MSMSKADQDQFGAGDGDFGAGRLFFNGPSPYLSIYTACRHSLATAKMARTHRYTVTRIKVAGIEVPPLVLVFWE
jgi:hypothetical protein